MPPKKKSVSPTVVKRKDIDWRGGTLNMMDLIKNLHDKPEGQSMSDGTELQAHKLILATASPYFEALFYGRFANNNNEPMQKIKLKDVEADVFRIIIQTIYLSGRLDNEVKRQDDKFLAIMEAADMYLLPKLFDIMAQEVTKYSEAGVWENILPHLDRISQLPLFAKVYKDIRKWIIHYLPADLYQNGTLWEKLCPRVQADVTEDLENIAWEKDAECHRIYIHLLRLFAVKGVPFTEPIAKINSKLTPLVRSFKNKRTFIKAMEKFIKLEDTQQKKVDHTEIHLEVKTLLKNKSWKELCQTAFGDIVNLLEHVNDNSNEVRFRFKWKPVLPSEPRTAPYWDPLQIFTAKESWKLFSNLFEFAHKYSLPRLIDHCELLLMGCLYNSEVNDLSYVIWASGKKIFENIHKLGMFKVLSGLPQHIKSPDWLKLTESEITFFRGNYHHFKEAEDRVWPAIEAWCKGTSNDASEAKNKYNRIRLHN